MRDLSLGVCKDVSSFARRCVRHTYKRDPICLRKKRPTCGNPPVRYLLKYKTEAYALDPRFRCTSTGPIIRNRLLRISFLIFRVFWIDPQALSFRPSLADAN